MWILNMVLTHENDNLFVLMISLSQTEVVVGNEETVRVNYDLQLFCRIREGSSWIRKWRCRGMFLAWRRELSVITYVHLLYSRQFF